MLAIELYRYAKRRTRLRPTFLYLMRNERNRFVKIGVSNNPAYRERTLQAEEPEITLLFKLETYAFVEEWLHYVFREKRVRGEWFELDDAEIARVPIEIITGEFFGPDGIARYIREEISWP